MSLPASQILGPITNVQPATLQGIASGLTIHGIGTVQYTCSADDVSEHVLRIQGVLYVPVCPSRLICPRQLLTALSPASYCTITDTAISIHFHGNIITVPYDANANLPILHTMAGCTPFINYCNTLSTSDHSHANQNLTIAQQIKLTWHQHLHHINFDQITHWMCTGTISTTSAVTNCPNPVCTTCLFGKSKKRSHKWAALVTLTSPLALESLQINLKLAAQALSPPTKAPPQNRNTGFAIFGWIMPANSSMPPCTLPKIPRRCSLLKPNLNLSVEPTKS